MAHANNRSIHGDPDSAIIFTALLKIIESHQQHLHLQVSASVDYQSHHFTRNITDKFYEKLRLENN